MVGGRPPSSGQVGKQCRSSSVRRPIGSLGKGRDRRRQEGGLKGLLRSGHGRGRRSEKPSNPRHMFVLQNLEAHANCARKDDVRSDSVCESQG
jgi:hypothetical protein